MKRLYKSRDRMFGGVLGGIAEYFGVDPTVVRLAFIVLAIFTAGFPCLIAYIIAMMIIPDGY